MNSKRNTPVSPYSNTSLNCNNMARYNKHNLAVAKFANPAKIRPEMNSVLFTEKHTVATDSFRLMRVSTPEGDYPMDNVKPIDTGDGILLPLDVVKAIKLPKAEKHIQGVDSMVITEKDESMSPASVSIKTVHLTDGVTDTVTANEVGGTFPKYESILKDAEKEQSVEVTLNAAYLAEMFAVISKMQSGSKQVTLRVPLAKNKPILLRGKTAEEQDIEAIVMPMVEYSK